MNVSPCVIGAEQILTEDTLDVVNPSTGELLGRTARGTQVEVDAAVAAARAASEDWRHTPVAQRAEILRRIGGLVTRERERLALLESRDTGKPLTQARADVDVAARYFTYYASTVEAFFGNSLPPDGEYISYTRHEAFGVTGHIIPWNYPLQIGCRTIAPAIAVGNCSVVKPAEDAPLSVVEVALLALEAGLPAGVLNVVPGLGAEAGAALSAHTGIDHLSFTGSVPVGSMVAKAASDNVIPVALELGGKSPNIVFADADLDVAVPVILKSFLQNAGQTCSAGSRLVVHDAVHGELLNRLEKAVGDVRIGAGPADPDLGPLISQKQLDRVTRMVERAAASADPRIGGPKRVATPVGGFYFPPTVFDGVAPDHEIAQDEVFGPVVAVTTFDSTQQAIDIANGTEYGLISAVWTKDFATAMTLTEEIRSGQVYVNTYGAGGGVEYTFGGFKKSGYGREKGFDALGEFCQTKSVVLKVAQ
ncbi:aldehyde dehydrogenase family protein [Aeromicrobium sp. CF4.19]|uniref:aldehyde dehydrogenase family protein n=1 Tax=Aeromicrobium sp. CF4.19 TaxID=3373082 RepID=UPI003EE7DE8B